MDTHTQAPPLIVHILYRLATGGIENGLVNLINNMPAYRHAIVCLTYSTDFKNRITRDDVEIYELHKQAGQDLGSFVKMYQLLRRIKPVLVNTNNLGTIEYQIPAFLAGVRCRVHGELGWDVSDTNGENVKYQWVRRLMKPFIQQFIPLSKHLETYLLTKVHVPAKRITRIINGVDTEIFHPLNGAKAPFADCPFAFKHDEIIIGTVGRMQAVKDQLTLVKAFILLCERAPAVNIKLIIAGDGPLREQALDLLAEKKLTGRAWLPGDRSDIPQIIRYFDVFVLPSLAEGIPNTVLEAMATGLPVIATEVGGNAELVAEGVNGSLVPAANPDIMAETLLGYVNNPEKRQQQGQQGRQRALAEFSLATMVGRYQAVYDNLLKI